MNQRSSNFLVGLTTLAGLVGLGFLLMMFGYVSAWNEKGFRIAIVFDHAAGLNTGSRVRFAGLDVGRVSTISLDTPADGKPGVKIIALIDEKYIDQIPYNVQANIESPLIGGSPAVGLRVMKEEELVTVTDAGHKWLNQRSLDEPLSGTPSDLVSQFSSELKLALQDPIRDLRSTSDAFNRLSTEWTAVGANIRELTNRRTLEQVDADPTKANIASIAIRVDQRLAEMKQVIAGAEKWINDEKLRLDIAQAAANAKSLTAKLDQGADDFTGLTKDAREQINAMARRYIAVADELSSALNSTKKLLDQARDGEGTTGKLINDPALYNNLNDSVKRIEATMVEVQLLIRKWKEEGLAIQF